MKNSFLDLTQWDRFQVSGVRLNTGLSEIGAMVSGSYNSILALDISLLMADT